MSEPQALKLYFGKDLAELLADKIIPVYPQFEKKSFVERVTNQVDRLALKDRVAAIADNLHRHLPADYQQAIGILLEILGPPNPKETGMFTEGYWLMPVANFVERHGLEAFTISMHAIHEITQRHTGEYAIRPFITRYFRQTLEVIVQWTQSDSVHVRRLASEGLRSRLPWASRLDVVIAHPEPVLEILEMLKGDSSRFVQKSVANNMNDILKDNYQKGMAVLQRWCNNATPHTGWIIRHALRNQVKRHNPEALKILEQIKGQSQSLG